MKYTELPKKWKEAATQDAIDKCNELYTENDLNIRATKESVEVLQYLDEHDYEVEYIKSIKEERLVIEGLY